MTAFNYIMNHLMDIILISSLIYGFIWIYPRIKKWLLRNRNKDLNNNGDSINNNGAYDEEDNNLLKWERYYDVDEKGRSKIRDE